MTKQHRRAYRRNGSWLIDHGFKRLGLWFYDIAQADWEMELAQIEKHRRLPLSGSNDDTPAKQ